MFCHFVRWSKINLQNTSSICNYSSILEENLPTHPDIHEKILHFKEFFSSKLSNYTKKEQNLLFKEPKEHFLEMSVLYRT